jgi:hypothetical protein
MHDLSPDVATMVGRQHQQMRVTNNQMAEGADVSQPYKHSAIPCAAVLAFLLLTNRTPSSGTSFVER